MDIHIRNRNNKKKNTKKQRWITNGNFRKIQDLGFWNKQLINVNFPCYLMHILIFFTSCNVLYLVLVVGTLVWNHYDGQKWIYNHSVIRVVKKNKESYLHLCFVFRCDFLLMSHKNTLFFMLYSIMASGRFLRDEKGTWVCEKSFKNYFCFWRRKHSIISKDSWQTRLVTQEGR